MPDRSLPLSRPDAPTRHAATGGPAEDPPNGEDGEGGRTGGKEEKNALEWAMTLLGAALVLFVVGFLTYQLFAGTDRPAELQIRLGEPRTNGSTVEVPVTVRNEGGRVAEAAVVEVCAGPESCAQLTFDYLPFESEFEGVMGLEAPLQAPLTTRVVSFRNP